MRSTLREAFPKHECMCPRVLCVSYFFCLQGAAGAVLTKLRESQFGWVFNDPVDPVHLNLPDYFEVKKLAPGRGGFCSWKGMLVEWFVRDMVGCFWSACWLVGWFVGWSVDGMVGGMDGWFVGWLMEWLVCWLIGWLVG